MPIDVYSDALGSCTACPETSVWVVEFFQCNTDRTMSAWLSIFTLAHSLGQLSQGHSQLQAEVRVEAESLFQIELHLTFSAWDINRQQRSQWQMHQAVGMIERVEIDLYCDADCDLT
ncbi:hypothetical protein HAX54_003627 [Datura stramonium]|uniref:Uncharacterized protein n=1 Tax=Datura stramonium TaxID=4076 RepID=A0ABS8T7W5_DATST|nr:hypothetical protein [Datura stramonium]